MLFLISFIPSLWDLRIIFLLSGYDSCITLYSILYVNYILRNRISFWTSQSESVNLKNKLMIFCAHGYVTDDTILDWTHDCTHDCESTHDCILECESYSTALFPSNENLLMTKKNKKIHPNPRGSRKLLAWQEEVNLSCKRFDITWSWKKGWT